MIGEIILIAMAILFGIMGIFLYNGKGAWTISGYNTASKEEKEKYDEKNYVEQRVLFFLYVQSCCVSWYI